MSTIDKAEVAPVTAPAAVVSARDADPARRTALAAMTPTAAKAPSDNVRLDKLAARLEAAARNVGHALEFTVRDDSHRVVVTVKDVKTGEVIRQIPSETLLRLAENADAGLLPTCSVMFDGRA